MKYSYSAAKSTDPEKTPQHGVIDAESSAAARQLLRSKGLEVYHLERYRRGRSLHSPLNIGRVSRTDIVLFTKNLAVMMKAGLTLAESLQISLEQARGKLKVVLADVLKHVESGESFSSAVESEGKNFPKLYKDIVHVGEVSGTLDKNLEYLAEQLAKDRDIVRKVWGAMLYPMFIIVGITGLGVTLATFVLPRLARLFQSLDVDLPLSTRVLIYSSNFIESYGWIVLGALIALVIIVAVLYRVGVVRYAIHFIMLRLPVIGRIAHHVNVTRLTRALGALLTSGLPLAKSLEAAHDAVENEVYKRAIIKINSDVTQGSQLTDALERIPSLFPRIVTRMVNVGENSGRLEEILLYLANFYEEELDEIAKNLSILLEPVLLIVIGVVIGFIGLSIITPIYQITSAIG